MTDVVDKVEQRLVESHLLNLRSVDRLRRLLADLNYGVGDEPISVTDWNPELAKIAKDGSLRAVEQYDTCVFSRGEHCLRQEFTGLNR